MPATTPCLVPTLAALLCAGCGLGLFESESGGFTDLPTEAAGPYGKPEVNFDTPGDEPYVVVDSQASLVDPTAIERDDGGFKLWFGRDLDNVADETEIWRAEIPSVYDRPDVEARVAMVAGEDWEQGRVAAPSVVALADGSLAMFYEGGVDTPSIGRANSVDGGESWVKYAGNPILTSAAEPSAVELDGAWILYLSQPTRSGIYRADSTNGYDWNLDEIAVLSSRSQESEAFDVGGVSDPCAVVEISEAGQLHFGLFYNGRNAGDDVAIGYAGSFDGFSWERFSGLEPVLHPNSPDEHGPAAILHRSDGVLFFHEVSRGRQRITAAVHP
jgi:hypothetical protein